MGYINDSPMNVASLEDPPTASQDLVCGTYGPHLMTELLADVLSSNGP